MQDFICETLPSHPHPSIMIHQVLALPRFTHPCPTFLTKGLGPNGSMFVHQRRTKNPKLAFCSADGQIPNSKPEKKRKVVEHVCLLKAKENLSEEKEKDMLDYLYTSQYQMRGIVAISVGSIRDKGDYTHALYMRFQKKEDLEKFYENSFILKVFNEHVTPFCHGVTNVDYESEVEDDILAIFRKGEEFNYGEEFVLLVSFDKKASEENVKAAMESFSDLTSSHTSLIAQSTQGSNINVSSKEFTTHAAIVRFRSLDAMEILVKGREYKDMWRSKFEPFIEKAVAINFSVDPVGTNIM